MGQGWKRFANFNPIYGYLMMKKMTNLFGYPFILLSGSMFFTQNGMMGDLSGNVQFPYYREAGLLDSTQYLEMNIIAYAPSNLKSFIGLITDLIPIGGHRKYYYMFAYVILGIVATILLAILPLDFIGRNPIFAALLFFCLNWTSAASDVLFESKNIELMQKNPHIKSDLLTFCWFLDAVGQLLPNFIVGFVASSLDVRVNFVIFLPFFFSPIPFLLMGGLIQDKIEMSNRFIEFNSYVLKGQYKLVIVSFVQFIVALSTMIITAFTNDTFQMIFGIVTGLIILILSFLLLNIVVAKWFCFLVLNAAFYIEVQQTINYFYLDENCVEDGPIFSNYTIINSWGSTLNNIMQFIALFCFQVLFYDWKFRHVFTLIIAIRIGSVFADLMIIYRVTDAIGISDEFIFLLGESTIGTMAFRAMLYVNSYMNAKLCPKYFEATMYSLLTASGYVGVTIAKFLGIYLIEALGVQSDHKPEKGIFCNFDNLGILTIICNLLVPLLSFPCIYLLIPNIRMNELIIKDQIDEKNKYVHKTNELTISE